jgi:hypothetical protein
MPFPERSTQSKGLRGLFIDRKLNLRFHALPQLALQECSFPFKAGSFLPSTVQSPDPQTGHTTLSCPASLDLPLSHVNSMQNCCSCNSPSCGPCHQQLVKNAGVHLAGRSPSSNLADCLPCNSKGPCLAVHDPQHSLGGFNALGHRSGLTA